jgi:hypothetical protein
MNTKHPVPTDSPQKITVESQLVYALWTQGRAYAGFEAEFEVKTLMVGDGAKVKATCFTEKGKKLGKAEGALVLNRFKGKVLIPESVKPDDYIYLQVEVAKIGIKGESNSIPVRPPLQAKSIKWSKKEAERDEEVTMTCEFTNGVEDGDEVQVIVYEHDNDGYHDKVVAIPTTIKNNKVEVNWKFIYQEDTDDIPTDEELKKYGKNYNPPEYFFVVMVDGIAVGNKQESGILEFKDSVDLTLTVCGQPHKNEKVKVIFADGTAKEVATDKDGNINLKRVVPGKLIVDLVNDSALRDEEENLLEEFAEDESAESAKANATPAKDVKKDDFKLSGDWNSGRDQNEAVMVDFESTYDHEFLDEEQERKE